MNQAMVIQNLRKSYGSHLVLDGISFTVNQGEIFALLGKNGAGKTTALECMEGMLSYEGGSISVKGKIGIQLQSACLPACIRPMEAITLFCKWNRTKPEPSLLKALAIPEMGKTPYEKLSTGQKRRLHLFLTLISHPDILFLDEPTAGLDVEGRISLHNQIRQLKALNKTIILASHDMAEVEALCDRIAILKEGKLLFCGTASELKKRLGRQFTIEIKTERGNYRRQTDSLEDTMLAILTDFKKKGLHIQDISIKRGTLEQHFMEATERSGL